MKEKKEVGVNSIMLYIASRYLTFIEWRNFSSVFEKNKYKYFFRSEASTSI